jgi:hypothetical protein
MTIWILALVLFVCLAYVGFAMGVIRVACTLVGLLIGGLLAFPLGHLLNPLLRLVGIQNPFHLWLTGPLVIFLLILIAFKITGFLVHQKVDVYYKYKAGDLRMGLWNRLSARLGLCLGLANGAVYLILISLVVYIFSYPTSQIASGDNVGGLTKALNLMGRHVHGSGMAKVVAGIDPMPDAYYKASDIVGLIYHNDLLEARLSRYPAFLMLGERPEFQDIANDKEFTELRQKQPAFAEIINHPKAQAIVNNPALLQEIWAIAVPNFKDLETFLKTGKSAQYDDQQILGRWTIDLNGALNVLKKTKPNLVSAEMQKLKRVLVASLGKTTLVAAPDKQIIIKNFGTVKPATKPNTPPTVDYQTLQGQWAEAGGKYQLTIQGRPTLEAAVEGDKLTISGDALPMRFDREF